MAKYIERLYDFQSGDFVLDTQLDEEYDQIIALLNGTGQEFTANLTFNHADEPALILNQLGAGPIFRAYKGGTLVAQIPNSGTPGTGVDLVNKAYLDAKVIPFEYTFYFKGNMQQTSKAVSFITPPSGTFTITGIRGQFSGGGGANPSTVFIRKNGVNIHADAFVTLTGTSFTVIFKDGTGGAETMPDQTLAADDIITAVCTVEGSTRSDVSITVVGKVLPA